MSSSNSSQRALSLRIPERFLNKAASAISSYLWREFQQEHSVETVAMALQRWLDQRFDIVLEEVTELLTHPGSHEASEFAQILERIESPASDVVPETVQISADELHPMFSGNRALSADRLAAMMGYFASKGVELYKTKLNKLLFYADLTGYYLTGRGISGAQYVNLPYGPVPDRFEDMIDHAANLGAIETVTMPDRDPSVRGIRPGADMLDVLDDADRKVLDWVIENYGSLSTSAITDLSHDERAYKDTRPGERIAYAYAQFLKKLPPKDLLEDNLG
jgi:uncharacterized phage-associated protein